MAVDVAGTIDNAADSEVDCFALIRQVGTPQVMAAQMRQLAAVTGLPHVTIQVISGTAYAGLLSGLTVTDHAESAMRRAGLRERSNRYQPVAAVRGLDSV